jgi:hypothetical protein
VRERTLIAAAVVTGIWAAACSKPAAETSRDSDKKTTAPVNLISTPAPEDPVVSSLEAGRDLHLTLPRPPARKPVELPMKGSGAAAVAQADGEAMHSHAAAAAELVPAMQVTTTTLASVSPDAAPSAIPSAASTVWARQRGRAATAPTVLHDSLRQPPSGDHHSGRDGGVRDDCDLHRRGGLVGSRQRWYRSQPDGAWSGTGMGGPMIANPAGLRTAGQSSTGR